MKIKYCLHCGKELVLKVRPGGSSESAREYSLRDYCNVSCGNKAVAARRRKARKEEGKSGPDLMGSLFRNPRRAKSYVEDAPMEEVYYSILREEGEL